MYSKELMGSIVKAMAKKRKMAQGGVIDEDDDEAGDTPMGLQDKGEYSVDDTGVGGSDALVAALSKQLDHLAYGGYVESGDDAEPGSQMDVASREPETLVHSADLSEAAKKAIEEKKKRRASMMR